MSYLATVVIPASIEHAKQYLPRAIESARNQTIQCEVVYAVDHQRRGAGYMRNRLTERVETPFVIYLDADDILEPDFVARTVEYYRQGTYVYPTYYCDNHVMQLSHDCIFWGGTAHAVTTLMPTAFWKMVGGFNETHPAEDTDFHLSIIERGVCPVYCPYPLFHYTDGGQRSKAVTADENYLHRVRRELYETHSKARNVLMGCGGGCGGAYVPTKFDPMGEHYEGDVLAITLYTPRPERGRVTGRVYNRVMAMGDQLWVDPRDLAAQPNMWQQVIQPEDITPDVGTVLALAERSRQAFRTVTPDEFATLPEVKPVSAIADTKRKRRTRKAG